ncbi:hypothetical protein U1Q18_011243 [Sarracenia purpurea var. burkii]
MPSLYSWSSKRSYKNGYVWNDLAENDIIYPSEEAEYVLKGSELIDGCTEKLQQLQVRSRPQQVPGPNFRQTRNPVPTKRQQSEPEADNNGYEDEDDDEEEEEGEEEEEDKRSYTSLMTPQYSRCSRGVSTDEIELQRDEAAKKINPTTELTLDNNSSPPSATSSTVSDKANDSNNPSKRFEDGDPVPAELSPVSRNSVLLHLISCGGSASFRGKSVPVLRQQPPATGAIRRSSGANLHKGVLCKTAAAGKKLVAAAAVEEEEEEEEMISCMSENPRFGNLHAEEKEYFSGSIVESIAEKRVQVESGLKRSSSYNEERLVTTPFSASLIYFREVAANGCLYDLVKSSKAELGEAVEEEEEPKRDQKAAGMKGKCIPRMKYTLSNSKQPKK